MRDATLSNIESRSREFVVDTLQPWMVRSEQEVARKLITAHSPLFAEHLVDGLDEFLQPLNTGSVGGK